MFSPARRFVNRGRRVMAAGRSRPYFVLADVIVILFLAAMLAFFYAADFILGDVSIYFAARSDVR